MSCLSIQLNGKSYDRNNLPELIASANTPSERLFYSEVSAFLEEWFNESDTVLVHTSGSTGEPKPICIRKAHMVNSAKLTCEFFGLDKNSSALLCMPVRYIAGKMMLVRAIVAQFSLLLVPPSSRPLENLTTPLDFIAVVPLQLYTSLEHSEDTEKLNRCGIILVGGGAIGSELLSKIEGLKTKVYSSYGMTETVSHIALRKLNGEHASTYYRALTNVKLSLSEDETLLIDAPLVSDAVLKTNDLVEFNSKGEFKIIGRIDNVINSGGIKLQIEKIEEKLQNLFDVPYVITSVATPRLGGAVTLLLSSNRFRIAELQTKMKEVLSTYELPKYIFFVENIPLTETKKVDRAACKALANELYNMNK